MCGRYGRTSAAETYARILDAEISPRLNDRIGYNLAPGTFQLCALRHPDTAKVTLGPAWWGFIPSWATDTKLSPINARSETVGQKKLFSRSYQHQRCLVAADWWYEWQQSGNEKQPFAIRPRAHQPFFFAGIWAKAARLADDEPASGQVTFAILTGEPHGDIARIHKRQPQALTADAARRWLVPELDSEALQKLLFDGRYDGYDSWPIGKAVGNPANDGPEIVARAEADRSVEHPQAG